MVENVILLVKGFTPNRGNNTHYIFKNINAFINEFGQSNVIRLSPNDYRIEQGRIIVKAIDGFYDEITYMALLSYDDEQDLYLERDARFFVVNSVTPLVGYYVYEVSLDLWATYNHKASVLNLTINQCNKRLSSTISNSGYFPLPDLTDTEGRMFLEEDHSTLELSELVCLIQLDHEIYWDILGNTSSATDLVGVNLQDLFTAWNNPTFVSGLGAISCLCHIIGSIYKTTSAGGLDFKAKPIKAWLVPADRVEMSSYYFDSVSSKASGGLTPADGVFTNIFKYVKPSTLTKSFDFDGKEFIGRKCYAGVRFNGLLLNLQTNLTAKINYCFAVSSMNLEVTIKQGDNQLDITKGFELPITTNAQVGTSTENIAKSLSLLPLAAKTAVDLGTGNVAGIATDAMGAGGFVASGLRHSAISGQISNGNAVLTYTLRGIGTINSPYVVILYSSIGGSTLKYQFDAYIYGALFDGFIEPAHLGSDLYDNFLPYENGIHFIEKPAIQLRNETFFKGEVTLNGINEEARAFISNEFVRGVFVKVLPYA